MGVYRVYVNEEFEADSLEEAQSIWFDHLSPNVEVEEIKEEGK